jgi:hypothetical protein
MDQVIDVDELAWPVAPINQPQISAPQTVNEVQQEWGMCAGDVRGTEGDARHSSFRSPSDQAILLELGMPITPRYGRGGGGFRENSLVTVSIDGHAAQVDEAPHARLAGRIQQMLQAAKHRIHGPS